MTSNPRAAYTTREVADRLGVSDDTVRRWFETGELAGFRIGVRIFIAREPFDELLAMSRAVRALGRPNADAPLAHTMSGGNGRRDD